MANLCSQITIHEDDDITDDDGIYLGFYTTTVECRAHLIYAKYILLLLRDMHYQMKKQMHVWWEPMST